MVRGESDHLIGCVIVLEVVVVVLQKEGWDSVKEIAVEAPDLRLADTLMDSLVGRAQDGKRAVERADGADKSPNKTASRPGA